MIEYEIDPKDDSAWMKLAIVLAEEPNGPLQLRALATGHSQVPGRPGFSQNLAQRSFARGGYRESTLESIVGRHGRRLPAGASRV